MYPVLSKLEKKSSMWFVQSSGPMKFCQIYQSTNWLIGKFDKNKIFCQICQLTNFCLKISNWWPPYWRGCCVSKLSSLGYCLPFSAPLCHISDRAGSHQKFTWHWAFSSIPKRITSSTHLATVISVEEKKWKVTAHHFPPLTLVKITTIVILILL